MNSTTPGGLLPPTFGTDLSDAGGSSDSSPHDSALLLVLALLPFAGRLLGDYAFHALERRLFPEVRVLPKHVLLRTVRAHPSLARPSRAAAAI
eukprot:COSAG01_NODE_19_length_39011_cov_38.134968_2_plen_93_part_00